MRDDDARTLLGSAVRFMLDERVRDRIIAETRGNPLALLELPRGLTRDRASGGLRDARGTCATATDRGELRSTVTSRSLHETRLLLLVAAAEPVGDPLLLWRAAERLGIAPAAATSAEADGLLVIGDRVMFRHPLVRSAMYRSAADEGPAGRPPGAGGGDRSAGRPRTGVRGIWPPRPLDRTSESPWSSSAPLTGPRPVAGSPLRPRFSNAPSPDRATPPGGRTEPSPPPRLSLQAGTFEVATRTHGHGRTRAAQ